LRHRATFVTVVSRYFRLGLLLSHSCQQQTILLGYVHVSTLPIVTTWQWICWQSLWVQQFPHYVLDFCTWRLQNVWQHHREVDTFFRVRLFRLFHTSSWYPESLSFPRSSDGGVMLCGQCRSVIAVTGSDHVIAQVDWVLFNGRQWMCGVNCTDDCLCWSEVYQTLTLSRFMIRYGRLKCAQKLTGWLA